jgi:hypothetical protein
MTAMDLRRLVFGLVLDPVGYDPADGSIALRCLATSPGVLDGGDDAVVRTGTFGIAPPPERSECGPVVRRLVPWTGHREPGAAGAGAPSGYALSTN